MRKLILVAYKQEEGGDVMDMTVKDVAIYVETERIAEVTRILPLPFQVAPFPFFDPPSGPRTSVLRYVGEWTDGQQLARRLVHGRVIRRVASHWSHQQERQGRGKTGEE